MEQDLGPALYALRAREVALAALPCAGCRSGPRVRVRAARYRPFAAYVGHRRGLRNVVSVYPGRWSVFGTGGNDQQRQAWAFVPRR